MKGFYSLFTSMRYRLVVGLLVLLTASGLFAQTCPSPTGLSVANLTTNSAILLWTQPGEGEQRNYDYVVSTNPITSSSWSSLSATTEGVVAYGAAQTFDVTQLPLTNLQPGTLYYVLLRQNCVWDYSGESSWQTLTFSTMCTPVSVPLDTMKFSSSTFPACWMTGGTILPVLQNSYRYGSDGYAVKLQNATDASSMLFTPALSGVTSASELVFRAYSPSGRQHFSVGVAPIDGDITSDIVPIYEDSTVAEQWIEFTASDKVGYYTNGYVYVIYAAAGSNSSTFYVDNILVQEASACPKPSSLEVNNITATSATFSWQENGSASAWVLEFTPEGGTPFTVNATSNPFTCSSLEQQTNYTVRVKADCGGSQSDYAPVSVAFRTACGALPLPYAEDFENYSEGYVLPDCFTTHTSGESYVKIKSLTTQALALEQYKETTPVYAVLPLFDADLSTLRAKFQYRFESPSYGQLEIGYMTDNQDVATFVSIDTLDGSSSFTQASVLFENAPQTAYIAFKWSGITSLFWYAAIDDIQIDYAPTCKAPTNLKKTNVEAESASFSWTQSSSASQWEVVWKHSTDTGREIVSSPSFTLTGLQPNTAYSSITLQVRAICQPGDTSEVLTSSFSIKTRCEAQTIPFYESFETLTSSSIPGCWDNSLDEDITQRWLSSGAGYDATRGIAYYASSSSDSYVGQRCLLMTPLLQLSEDARLSFLYRNPSPRQARFDVWVCANGDVNNVDTLASALSANDWEKRTFDLSAYTGQQVCVVFVATTLGGEKYGSSVFLDDVTVEALVAPVAPQKAWVEEITANSAKVYVVGGDGDIIVEYGSGLLASAPKSSTDTTVITLSDLQESTTYSVTVYAQLSEQNQSRKLAPFSFRTDQLPISLPYATTNFADWILINGTETNYWAVLSDSLCIVNNGKKGYNIEKTSNVYASRAFTAPEDAAYSISFKWRAYGESSFDFLWAVVVPATEVIEAGRDIKTTMPDTWKKLGKETYLNQHADLQQFGEDVLLTAGDYKLLLYWRNDGSTGKEPAAIVSDLSITKLTCTYPNKPVIKALSYDSVSFSWNSTGAESYDVKVFYADSIPSDISSAKALFSAEATTLTSITFRGLQDNTDYVALVRANCGAEDVSKWSEQLTFTTLCAPKTLPYTEGFEDDNTLYECWTITKSEGGDFDKTTSTSGVHSGSTAVYGKKATFSSMELAFEEGKNLSNYMLTGFAKPETNGISFTVGIQKSLTDLTSYLPVSTISLQDNTSWTEFAASFAPLATLPNAAEYKYIVFNLNADGKIILDDIVIDEIPTCPKPASVTIVDLTADSARIDWQPLGTETKWEVSLLKDTVVQKKVVVAVHPYTLTGLQSQTSYTVQVRAICAEGDTSAIRDLSFQTPCSAASLPFLEDFNSLTAGIPACWNNERGTTTTESYRWNYYSASGYNSTACVRFNSYSNPKGNTNFLVTVPVHLTGEARLSFSYKKPNTDSGFDVYLSVDGSLTFADTLAAGMPYTNTEWADTLMVLDTRFIGQTVSIVFKGTSDWGYGDDYIYLDNVAVEAIPLCELSKTFSVKIEDIFANSAKIIVSDTAQTNIHWEYVVGKKGFAIDEATPISSVVDTVLLEGLNPSTAYSVYVRHYCDEENVSPWTKAIDFVTPCATMPMPFLEDFNSLATGIPHCWDNEAGTTTTESYRWNYSASGYNSTSCVRFDSYANTRNNTNFLKTPPVEITEKARLKFSYRKQSGSELDVYLSLDGGATYVDTLADNLSSVNEKTWEKATISLDARYVGSVITLAFKGTSDYGSGDDYIYLDNVVVEAVPECDVPQKITVLKSERTSAIFTITRLEEQTDCTFEYVLLQSEEELDVATPVALSSDTFTITSLQPQTDYLLYVRTVCTEGKYSGWSEPTEFTTLCAALNLPYAEDFGSYAITQYDNIVMPSCWAAHNEVDYITSTNYTSKSYVRVASPTTSYTNYGASGNYLFFSAGYNYYSSNPPVYAVLPEFTTPLDYIEISFTTKFGSADTTKDVLTLGYLKNTDDLSSFVALVAIPKATALTRHTFELADYNAPDTMAALAFRHTLGSAYTYYCVGVDDIEVTTLSHPTGLKVSNLTYQSADIAWLPFRNASSYETMLISGTDTVRNTVSGTSEQLVALSAITDYQYKVRAIIAEGDTSEWSKPLTFSSKTRPAVVPYLCGFEDEEDNNQWLFANNSTNKWYISGADSSAVKTGAKALYISNNGGNSNAYSDTQTNSYAYRTISFEPGNYMISFDWKANGYKTTNYYIDYMAAFLVPESETIVADKYDGTSASSVIKVPNDWIALENNGSMHYLGDTLWKTAKTVVTISEQAKYNLVFMWANDNNLNMAPPASVDNISISVVSCMPVSGLAIEQLSDSGVAVKWNSADAAAYQVVCLPADALLDDALVGYTPASVTSPAVVVDTLQTSTAYTLYVRAVCDEGQYSEWMSISFTTADQAEELPYSTGFEGGQDTDWNFIQTGATNLWYIGAADPKDGAAGLYVSGNGGASNIYIKADDIVYATRSFNVPAAGEYTFEFDYKCEGDSYETYYWDEDDYYYYDVETAWMSAYLVPATERIEVNKEANSNWTTLTTYRYDKTTWEHFTKTVYIAAPGTYTLAFQWVSENNSRVNGGTMAATVDNVTINQVLCSSLQSAPLVSSVTMNSALLSWTRESDGLQVRLGQSENIATSGTALLDTVVLSDTVCSLVGLSADNIYYVAVRPVCQDGDALLYATEWKTINFRTSCAPQELPYSEDFEEDVVRQSTCWGRYSGLFTDSLNISALTQNSSWSHVTTGNGITNNHMKLNIYGESCKSWLMTPSIYIDNAEANLMFDLALTKYYTANPIEDATQQQDDRFVVAISADNGNTWLLRNAREWNNTGSPYVYNEISHIASKVTMPLADYVGDTIRIAFYGESTQRGGDNDLHIGNINVFNGIVQEVRDTVCANTDYDGYGINVTKDKLTPGMSYSYSAFKTVEGATTLYNLALYVLPEANVEVYDTICANTPYEKYGFQIAHPTTRTYVLTAGELKTQFGCDSLVTLHLFVPESEFTRQLSVCETELPYTFGELSITESGIYTQTISGEQCDSTITLNLQVIPATTEIRRTICQGEEVTIAGQSFSTEGEHRVVMQNVLGCDSTIVLHLTVKTSEGYSYTGYLCQGGTYSDDNFSALTSSGEYERTFRSSLGCDSIVHLNLMVAEAKRTSIQETICSGDVYTFDGKDLTSSGEFTGTFVSMYNCDSIVTLQLTVLPTAEVEQELTLTVDQLPYVFASLPDSTYIIDVMPEGTYWPTIEMANAAANGCDSIVSLTLQIKQPESVDYVQEGRLNIVPNVIDRDGTVFIRNSFNATDKQTVTVEVFDAVGHRVSRQSMSGHNMMVQGFHSSGVYMVRVTDADKRTFIGQVLVR